MIPDAKRRPGEGAAQRSGGNSINSESTARRRRPPAILRWRCTAGHEVEAAVELAACPGCVHGAPCTGELTRC